MRRMLWADKCFNFPRVELLIGPPISHQMKGLEKGEQVAGILPS